jgi:hypothetical protein
MAIAFCALWAILYGIATLHATCTMIAVFGIWCEGRTPLNKPYESAIGREA